MDTQYLKKIVGYIVTTAVSVLIIIYIMYHLWGDYTSEINTVASEFVTMEQSITVDASLLREEKVLYASSEGTINYLYDSGKRVGAGETVAQIYADNGIGNKLIDIDSRISVLEKSSFSDAVVLSDTTTLDTKIDDCYYSMLEKLRLGNFDSAMSGSSELLILLNKRALVTKQSNGYADEINLLRTQRDELTSTAGDMTEYIVTDKAGYFYPTTDGYEGIYTSKNCMEMQMSDYDLMCSSVASSSVYSDGSKHAVGKIVTDYSWYIACVVSKIEYRSIAADRTEFSVIFPSSDDKRVTMTLVRVVNPADDDRVLLLFKAGDMPEGFDYSRHQTAEIITGEYSGYKVPVSSVRLENGVKGVYILDSSTIYFREIVPLFERDGWIVCEEKDITDESQSGRLALYDFIVTGGKDLYDGKVLK